MKKIIGFASIVLISIALLFVITSCANSINNNNNNGNQELSNVTSTNPDNPGTDENVYYTITFKDYDGTVLQTSNVKNGETPTYNKTNPSRNNDDNYSYTFSGWQPTLTKVSEDAVYTATYTSQSLPYYVTINLNGGTSSVTKLQFRTDKISKDMLPFDVKKSGFIFKGYSLNNVKVYDENGNVVSNFQPSANMTFKAIYEESVTLTVFYTLYNPKIGQLIETFNEKPTDIGNVSETRSYNYNTYVDLFAYANEGYTFVGWYNEGQVLSNEKDYKYMMWDEDFTIEARFNYTLYDLNVWSNNPNLGQVIIRNGNSQTFYDEETLEEYYKESVTVVAYSKTDTRFLGWYDEKNELVSTNAVYSFNMLNRDYTLEAKWNNFNITYDLDGGINNINNPTSYNADMQNITLLNPTRDGYTFQGWQYNGNVITQINTANICHMNLKALWTANTNTSYKVEHYQQNINDNNYPTTPFETDNHIGTTDTLTNGSVKTYEGFTSPEITQVNINGDGTTVIKLYYTRNSYIVSLNTNNDNYGTVTGDGTYKYQKEITITAKTNSGYRFIGWYKNDEEYTTLASFEYEIGSSNVTFEARYTINQYTITINNQAEGVTISGITSGNSYDYNSQITLSSTGSQFGYTVRWERSDGIVYVGDNYGFIMPSSNITITTTTRPYTKEGNKIYFGTYPQTKVTDNTLISELNTLAGTKPTSSNKYNWIDYDYYISSSVTSFMYYQDIDYDNNGTYDYRGVYFTSYRPYFYYDSSSTSNSDQDNNGYTTNTIYWFSYDPIEWDILTESSGKALIIANLILDSQDYYPNMSTSSFSHNGGTGYANNYELSNIRKWLNDNFYNTAFNDLQKALIETTTVDNSSASTGQISNSYACNKTNDKMFLLSYKEATTYYTSDSARYAQGSDYAKCQGLYVNTSVSYKGNSHWWWRSPYYNNADYAYFVNGNGNIDNWNVYISFIGVRPACYIIL